MVFSRLLLECWFRTDRGPGRQRARKVWTGALGVNPVIYGSCYVNPTETRKRSTWKRLVSKEDLNLQLHLPGTWGPIHLYQTKQCPLTRLSTSVPGSRERRLKHPPQNAPDATTPGYEGLGQQRTRKKLAFKEQTVSICNLLRLRPGPQKPLQRSFRDDFKPPASRPCPVHTSGPLQRV